MRTRLTINPGYELLRAFVETLPTAFASTGETVFVGRNTVKRFVAGDGTVMIVKRFGHLHFVRRLIYSTVCRTKARRAYDNGLRFVALGFDSPEPVACIETTRHGVLEDSYFVSIESEAKALFPELVEAQSFDKGLADSVAGLMADLHEAGAVHGDPNLNNLLYRRGVDGSVRLTLIDTNRSYFRRRLSRKECLRNLMRVTHRRDLMRYIASRYAELRELDPEKTVGRIFSMLAAFERSRRIRHKVKSIILRRPVD